MNYSCDLLLNKLSANIFLIKFDSEKEIILNFEFIKHTPYSKYEDEVFKNSETFFSLFSREDLNFIRRIAKKAKTNDYIEEVIKLRTKDGRYIFLNVFLSVIEREGSLISVIGYAQEVSEREELRKITEKIFSFEELGVLVYQEKVVFANALIKKVLGIKENDDMLQIFKNNPSIVDAIKKRLRGEDFNVFRQEFEFIIKGRRIYGDYFSTTVLYKNRYSGLVLFLDKTEKVKKEKFIQIVNKVYAMHLSCKNIDLFLNSAVEFINHAGYNCFIKYKNSSFGVKKKQLSVMEIQSGDFEFCISSDYRDDFKGIEDTVEKLFFVLKNSIETIQNNKNLILLKNSFDESYQAVVITDEELNVVYYNKIFKNLIKGRVSNLHEVFENIEVVDMAEEKILIGRDRENKKFFIKAKIIPVKYDKNYYVFQGLVLSDNYSIFDSLTNLLNRRGFIEKNTLHPRRALVVIDIYEFKSIVETKGKDFAEDILKSMAAFLQEEVSYIDLGRVGGDEFAFLIDLDRLEEDLSVFIEKLINKITKELKINVNIGVAIANENLNNLEILLEKAYIALNHAVKKGVNTFEIYNEFIASRKRKYYKAQALIKRAIENSSFIFHFHPYVDAQTYEIVGVESLLRIIEDGKIIYPSEFIDFAEESGLISEIEDITFPMAMEYAKKLPINFSYNLSAYTFEKDGFYNKLPKLDNFIIEITERILRDMHIAKERISQIKSKNISVAIDDFGTGYSNFISLKELDFDILKIDMGFIKNLENSKKDVAIVKSIIEFAKTVGLKTVAEGVENENQVEILKNLGCDYLQGFYFYKPMPFEELKKLLGGGNE